MFLVYEVLKFYIVGISFYVIGCNVSVLFDNIFFRKDMFLFKW